MTSDTGDAVDKVTSGTETNRAVKVLGIITGVTLALIVVQISLAGLGAFSALHTLPGHDANFGPHQALGYVISLCELLIFGTAIATKRRQFIIVSAIALVLAGPIQPTLANLGNNTSDAYGALHAFVGVAIMGLTGFLFGATRRR